MNTSRRLGLAGPTAYRSVGTPGNRRTRWLALALALLFGCGRHAPPATVVGTLRLNGEPLDNCLVTFFPESSQGTKFTHSTGLTGHQGLFRLRSSSQHEGAALGWHRVTVQDLSVSTGVDRRDNGPVDAATNPAQPPPPLRRSRVPDKYLSLAETPLRQEIKPGHQVIDLDID
jgi:hypothetical protein